MILVTGANGFIGKALVSDLQKINLPVCMAVRNQSETLSPDFEAVEMPDLADLASKLQAQTDFVSQLCDSEVVIHLAALVHGRYSNTPDLDRQYHQVNCDATLALAQLAADSGVKRFIFLSSIGVNGSKSITPFTEDSPAKPHNYYARSKYEAERGLLEISRQTELEIVIVRPPLVYGFDAPGNFATLVRVCGKFGLLPFGSIKNQRSLVSRDNLVNFLSLCADRKLSPAATNQVFLISDGEDISTAGLVSKVASLQNKRPLLMPIPKVILRFLLTLVGKRTLIDQLLESLQIDSSKARRHLGWKPVVNLDQGLKQAVQGSKLCT